MTMSQMNSLLAQRIFQIRMSGLADYATTLERLLATEVAAAYARETLSVIARRAGGDQYIDEEPSEDLEALRDDFPSILRGSLFLYVVSCFENQARVVINAKIGRAVVGKGHNLKQIAAVIENNLPGTIDEFTANRLIEYKHLRDACAHTGAEIASSLHELRKASGAAQSVPGVTFTHFAEQSDEARAAFTKDQMALGNAAFTSDFIPTSISFFNETFLRIVSARLR